MDSGPASDLYSVTSWYTPGLGPRYQQFARHLARAIRSRLLPPDTQLPSERDLAEIAEVSRVTIRKAVAELVAEGLVEQRHGAGSFVLPHARKLQQSLSSLVSFTENMTARGKTSSSVVLQRGLFAPMPDELMVLGLTTGDRVARVRRLRSAGDVPMAIEISALPEDILPRPDQVSTSLYAVLRQDGAAPTRAIQRVTAANLGREDAGLLNMAEGDAVLQIDRTGYLASGRPIEYTRGLYRSDLYDFVSELRLEGR